MSGTTATPPPPTEVHYPDRERLERVDRLAMELRGELEQIAWTLEGALNSDAAHGPDLAGVPAYTPDLFGWLCHTMRHVHSQAEEIDGFVDRAMSAGEALLTFTVLEREHQERVTLERGERDG